MKGRDSLLNSESSKRFSLPLEGLDVVALLDFQGGGNQHQNLITSNTPGLPVRAWPTRIERFRRIIVT